jgi:two-component system chemotaxis response regulator CheY
MRVLIVDDNQCNCQLLQIYLSKFKSLVIVNNGIDAIKVFSEALSTGERIGLIYLDYCMPEISGLEALRYIRKIESKYQIPYNNRVRIVMLSAVIPELIVNKAYEGGCDSFIRLPVSKQQVIDEIYKAGLSLQLSN